MLHRNPFGTRDDLPSDASALDGLKARMQKVLVRAGCVRVGTPPIESIRALEQAVPTLDRKSLLRFVDTDTGEGLALRPDITPQIARMMAQHRDVISLPIKVWYEGDVMRRTSHRARLSRQISQLGVEWIGHAHRKDDAALLGLAIDTLKAAGLATSQRRLLVELRATPLARSVLHTLNISADARAQIAQALSRKDRSALEHTQLPAAEKQLLLALCAAHGQADAFARLKLPRALQQNPLLAELAFLLRGRFVNHVSVRFDLSECQDHGYYTGVSYAFYADGPGDVLGGGGRYDDLLGRFGFPNPALGFAFDLGHVALASGRTADPNTVAG